ncbi:complement C1q tumor necrosis factor-related protein 3-like [Stegastes partitus]|uniref:Complement C1q tumor necrosis factor-related protein 3-like n=1 Tax=Stegastes partitus TaxID=144197 RepID=A0A3B5ABM7_9TELE|nr:PREDICTED: complement C1q tumor necrosis factor-related protein 3-like [Stegastes partitus]
MVSSWFLVVLGVCSLVGVQAEVILTATEDDAILNPEQTTENDLRVLVLQLKARVEKLEKEREDRVGAQVAFSASLRTTTEWTHVGPYDTNITMLFKKVTTNIGNAYDKDTGIFTAPVKGLYYLRFTGCVGNSGTLNAALFKNGINMFAIYNTLGTHSSGSNGMTLELEKGDQVWIILWPSSSVFDQSRLTTFSGFLVFPM